MKEQDHPLIWPDFWKEGNTEGDQFNHDNVSYDLNVVRKDVRLLPRVLFEVKDLEWLLDHCEWTEEDEARKVYLKRPIFCVWWNDPDDGQKKIVVVDGYHRLKRAVRLGMKYLPGIWVPDETMNKARLE